MENYIYIKVKRCNSSKDIPYYESFRVPYKPNMNVISVLTEIRKSPINLSGEEVAPVVWECNCLEGVCGGCAMLINGRPNEACSFLVDTTTFDESNPIILEPLSKFTVIRDLMVDRKVMFESLKKVNAWIPLEECTDEEQGTIISEDTHEWTYAISRCTTCGCCLEACPNVNKRAHFIGPQAVSQVVILGMHPNGKSSQDIRLAGLTEKGGIQECGKSKNCKAVCPKSIDLTTNIAIANRAATKYRFKSIFKR